eukprot:403333886
MILNIMLQNPTDLYDQESNGKDSKNQSTLQNDSTYQHSNSSQLQLAVVNQVQLAKKIMNTSNSLAIVCMQNGLIEVAFNYLNKSARLDLTFFELQSLHLKKQLTKWRGRVLLNNILAYFFYVIKDFGNALKYTFEAQQYAVELNEQRNRDCDYIISVNFVTFLILWKIGKYQEAKRYIDINRKLIDVLLDEKNRQIGDGSTHMLGGLGGQGNQSSLSVIMESSHQTFNKQSLTFEGMEGGDALMEVEENSKKSNNGQKQQKQKFKLNNKALDMFDKKIDRALVAKLMASDSEDDQVINHQQDNNQQQQQIRKAHSRLSQLSKLNLLGLIDLSLIAADLKVSKDVDKAIKNSEDSIQILKITNKTQNEGAHEQIGIASQNLIEELRDNLLKIKEKDLDLDDINNTPNQQQQIRKAGQQQIIQKKPDQNELENLRNIRKGNKIITSKEFKLVFYITCFVPFIRPNMALIRETSIVKAKQIQRDHIKKRRQAFAITKEEEDNEIYQFDYSSLEYFKQLKDNLLDENAVPLTLSPRADSRSESQQRQQGHSVLVQLYEEEQLNKQKHDLAFQRTIMNKKQDKQGYNQQHSVDSRRAYPNKENHMNLKPNFIMNRRQHLQTREKTVNPKPKIKLNYSEINGQQSSNDTSMMMFVTENNDQSQANILNKKQTYEENKVEQSSSFFITENNMEGGSLANLNLANQKMAFTENSNQKAKSAGNYSSQNQRLRLTQYSSGFPKINENSNKNYVTNTGSHQRDVKYQFSLSNKNQNPRVIQRKPGNQSSQNMSYYSNMFPSYVPKQKFFQGTGVMRRNIYQGQENPNLKDVDILNMGVSPDKFQHHDPQIIEKLTSYKYNSQNLVSNDSLVNMPKNLVQKQEIQLSQSQNSNIINQNAYDQKIENLNSSGDFSNFTQNDHGLKNLQNSTQNQNTQLPKTSQESRKPQLGNINQDINQSYILSQNQTYNQRSNGLASLYNFEYNNYQQQKQQRLRTQQRPQRFDVNSIGNLLQYQNQTNSNLDREKQIALKKIEAQLEKNNKRFKMINNLATEYVNQKTNNHAYIKSKDTKYKFGINTKFQEQKWNQLSEGIRSNGERSSDNFSNSNNL